jgi:transposase
MKIYPGNESEKPVLRDVINSLKSRNHIEGRTIQVADKGLNCSTNILEAKKNGDGYIFSKSVKTLPEVEKTWVLLNKDYKVVHDENGKLKYTYKSCIDTFQYTYKDEYGKKRTASVREKRIVTYNPKLAKKHTMEIQRMVEKANSLTYSLAKKSEYGESAKYVKFASTDSDGNITDEKIAVGINQEKIDEDLKLAGYNMLITSEVKMGAREIYETYHQLWRIEETFRVLKTDLEARPVYLQKEDSIKGHFLVCYIAILLLRIFQFKVLENRYGSSQVIKFIQDFRVVKTSGIEIINLMNDSPLVREIAEKYKLPIMHASLTKTDIKKVLNSRIW